MLKSVCDVPRVVGEVLNLGVCVCVYGRGVRLAVNYCCKGGAAAGIVVVGLEKSTKKSDPSTTASLPNLDPFVEVQSSVQVA